MADKKIIDLPALLIQNPTDLYETSADGTGSYKETRAEMLLYMNDNVQITAAQVNGIAITQSNTTDALNQGLNNWYATQTGGSTDNLITLPTIVNLQNQINNFISSGNTLQIYVDSVGGIDAPLRGSAIAPYKTLSYALLQITDNLTNTYLINAQGNFSETNWTIRPNINYNFNNGTLNVTNQVTLDPSFSAGGVVIIQNLFNSSFSNGFNLDFDGVGVPFAVFWFSRCNFNTTSTINIVGNSSNPTIAIIESVNGFTNIPSIQIQNCYGAAITTTIIDFTYTHTSNFTGGNFNLIGLEVLENCLVQDSTNTGLTLFMRGCLLQNTTLTSNGSGIFTIYSFGNQFINDLILYGANVQFKGDILQSIPILDNGATYVPVSLADSINANYSPINYSVVNASVQAQFAGIDTAIGSLIPVSSAQLIYIDESSGNDTTGNGSINFPYQTYEKARTVAIVSASAILPYGIKPIGVFNITGNMIISPFVSILGDSATNSIFNISGQLLLDSSWGTISQPLGYIAFCGINANTMNLIYSAYQGGSSLIFDNVSLSTTNFNAIGTGINPNPETISFLNCLSFSNTPTFTMTNITTFAIGTDLQNGFTAINNSSVTENLTVIQNSLINVGNIFLSTTNSGSMINLISSNTIFEDTVTIDGVNTLLIIDSSSYMFTPIFTNGATLNNVYLASLSDGVNANVNFSPNYYNPTAGINFAANSVTGNLQGIDHALSHPYQRILPLTSNITLSQANIGYCNVSDDANAYTVTLQLNSSISSDAECEFISGEFNTITFSFPIGVTVNSQNGGTITLNAGNIPGILRRIANNTYLLFLPDSATLQDMQQTYDQGSGIAMIEGQPITITAGSSYSSQLSINTLTDDIHFLNIKTHSQVTQPFALGTTTQRDAINSSLLLDGDVWNNSSLATIDRWNGATSSWQSFYPMGVGTISQRDAINPAVLTEGDLWNNTTTNTLDRWNGTLQAWYALQLGVQYVNSTTQLLIPGICYITITPLLTTYTLPANCRVGQIIQIIGTHHCGKWVINQNSGQIIYVGQVSTTGGTSGSIACTENTDCITLVCSYESSILEFTATSVSGALVIT